MMSNSICRFLFRSGSNRVSYLYPIARFSPFSSKSNGSLEASKSISETANSNDSFDTTYLRNTFGFSQEKALSASKYLKISSTDKPESFVAFLKSRGFTAEQIGSIARKFPLLISKYDPQKVLMPKIEFFLASGISEAGVNNIILRAPIILSRSLENYIIPYFSYIKSLFDSTGTTLNFNKELGYIFICDLEIIKSNIDILRAVGVPHSRILVLLQSRPRTLMVKKERFIEVVKEVKQMNFVPNQGVFIDAVRVICEISKVNWKKKMAVCKKWGFSENDVMSSFKRFPNFMMKSTDKLTAVMMFLVNEMGLDYSFVVKRPIIVAYDLEKRIKPRCAVYKVLVANGLIKNVSRLATMLHYTDAIFLKEFVLHYEKEVPGVLQVYQKTLAISKVPIC